MLTNVSEAKNLYNENDNTLWQEEINNSMENYWLDFQLIDCEDKSPVRYKEITCHLIFDVKIDPTQKAQLMVGGNLTNHPSSMTYVSNVSQEIIRISFLVASSNYLGILAGDI